MSTIEIKLHLFECAPDELLIYFSSSRSLALSMHVRALSFLISPLAHSLTLAYIVSPPPACPPACQVRNYYARLRRHRAGRMKSIIHTHSLTPQIMMWRAASSCIYCEAPSSTAHCVDRAPKTPECSERTKTFCSAVACNYSSDALGEQWRCL
jgi:hypothetical protein